MYEITGQLRNHGQLPESELFDQLAGQLTSTRLRLAEPGESRWSRVWDKLAFDGVAQALLQNHRDNIAGQDDVDQTRPVQR